MQKLIFLDIDGTLTIPGHNTPPPSAQEAIRRARANGHQVFLCTGRNYGMLYPLLQYGFDGFAASVGGHIECGGKVIYDCPMTPEQQEKALDVFQRNGVYRTVESWDSSYTDEGFKIFLRRRAGENGNSELLRWQELIESNLGIGPMSEYQGEPLYKIVFMSPKREYLDEPIRELGGEFNFCMEESEFGMVNGELVNRKFNKGLTIRRVSEYLQIPMRDTIAFGDSMNDYEMLQTAALGICMENGSEKLKRVADAVCPSVGEDGIYRAFEVNGLI